MSLTEFEKLYRSVEYPAQYSKTIGAYTISAKIRPGSYHFSKVSGGNDHLGDSLNKLNDSVVFFDFKIASLGPNSPLFEGDQELLEERLMYYMTYAADDFSLSDGEGEYVLINHHMERNYNTNNSINMQLAFRKPIEQDFTFRYNDRILNIGTINLAFDHRDIDRIPSINY